MRRFNYFSISVVLVTLGFGSGWRLRAQFDQSAETRVSVVDTKDIPKDVVLIGKLEVPFLTVVKITGRWQYSVDDVNKGAKELSFIVESAMGRKLKCPAVYFLRNIDAADAWMYAADEAMLKKPINGEEWTGFAYETAKYWGHPNEIYDHINAPYRRIPEDGQFVCELKLFDITISQ